VKYACGVCQKKLFGFQICLKGSPMDISLIIKVAGVGILVSVATQILSKSGRDEQSMLVTLSGIVVVLLLLVDEIALLFDRICAVFGF
jgi:stage III sporulation protein AC